MKRSSGVLMHVSSLWGKYSEGALGAEAREWVDFLASCGFHVWQVLPFCLPDDCNSPYKSFSAFSVNPYFIDLPTLRDAGLLTDAELKNAEPKTPYACEFERLNGERMELLGVAASRVKDRTPIDAFFDGTSADRKLLPLYGTQGCQRRCGMGRLDKRHAGRGRVAYMAVHTV